LGKVKRNSKPVTSVSLLIHTCLTLFREYDEIDDAMMDINKELQEEMDASKVLFIIKKTLKGTVLDHINSFALLLDDVKKLAEEMPDSSKEYFVLDRVT
jgi:hypothetical protein